MVLFIINETFLLLGVDVYFGLLQLVYESFDVVGLVCIHHAKLLEVNLSIIVIVNHFKHQIEVTDGQINT